MNRAIARAGNQVELRIPIHRWSPNPPPYVPRCRRCGCQASARAGRCPACGGAL